MSCWSALDAVSDVRDAVFSRDMNSVSRSTTWKPRKKALTRNVSHVSCSAKLFD